MIIQRGTTQAEITENLQQRRISLRFRGPSIPEFRAVIIDELDSISQSYHQLQYEKMIPCQCSECTSSSQPEFFDYSVVKKRQERGKKDTIECRRSEEDVSLSLLLQGYEIQAILKALPDKQNGGQNGDPAPPAALQPVAPPALKTIKIFLASSSELKEDREQFEIFINRQNKNYTKDGIFLELFIWEDFLNAMSKTRSQDEYNKAIESCDVFVMLACTKVGKYTNEEFLVAVETFQSNDDTS